MGYFCLASTRAQQFLSTVQQASTPTGNRKYIESQTGLTIRYLNKQLQLFNLQLRVIFTYLKSSFRPRYSYITAIFSPLFPLYSSAPNN